MGVSSIFMGIVALLLINVAATVATNTTIPVVVPQNPGNIGDKLYLGCSGSLSGFKNFVGVIEFSQVMTLELCISTCASNYNFYGIQGDSCYCSLQIDDVTGPEFATETCSYPCKGNPSEACGGYPTNSTSVKYKREVDNRVSRRQLGLTGVMAIYFNPVPIVPVVPPTTTVTGAPGASGLPGTAGTNGANGIPGTNANPFIFNPTIIYNAGDVIVNINANIITFIDVCLTCPGGIQTLTYQPTATVTACGCLADASIATITAPCPMVTITKACGCGVGGSSSTTVVTIPAALATVAVVANGTGTGMPAYSAPAVAVASYVPSAGVRLELGLGLGSAVYGSYYMLLAVVAVAALML